MIVQEVGSTSETSKKMFADHWVKWEGQGFRKIWMQYPLINHQNYRLGLNEFCRNDDASLERAPKRIKLEQGDKASESDVTSLKKPCPGHESIMKRNHDPPLTHHPFHELMPSDFPTCPQVYTLVVSIPQSDHLRKKFQINSCAELVTDESGESMFLVSTGKNQFLQWRELFFTCNSHLGWWGKLS